MLYLSPYQFREDYIIDLFSDYQFVHWLSLSRNKKNLFSVTMFAYFFKILSCIRIISKSSHIFTVNRMRFISSLFTVSDKGL